MKKKVYILGEIFEETQKRFPHIDLRKFDVLYHGWRQQGIRRGRNAPFYVVAWRRNWLGERDAEELRKYIGLC